MAATAAEATENKIWNAYIDKYEQEPFNMGKLHNFAIGPNNPYDTISFQIAAKIYRRNKGKGKIKIIQLSTSASSILDSDDIIKLKKQNEELRKQVDTLLSEAGRKKDVINDVKEDKKEQKEEDEKEDKKSKSKYMFKDAYRLWFEIEKRIQSDDIDFIRQLLNDDVVTVNSFWPSGGRKSMLQLAASHGQYKIVQMLLNLGANVNYKYRWEKDALQQAQRHGHYHVEKLLMLSKMDASATEQINKIANTINTQKGVMYYMFKAAEKKQNTDAVFGGLVDIMIDVINQRQAFSDDVLNLSLDYSIKKALESSNKRGEGGDGGGGDGDGVDDGDDNKENINDNIDRDIVISTDLWQCIYKTCCDIITDKKHNKLDWYWLKTYLLSSSIWFRQFVDNRNNGELSSLYFELLDIVSGQALTQIDVYLKEPFRKIANKNKNDWDELITFDVKIDHKGEIRQDAIENGHKSQYTRDILGKKCVSIDPFNAFSHYDINEYLSSLVLTAQMINTQFQKDIVKIFQVNIKTLVGKYDVIYKEGPVKLLSRCQAKAETDYKNELFPVSAHILDINRCSLIFENINSMLRGLKLFEESIRNHKQNDICIIKILRVKNGWKEYDHEKPMYSDIKFNVVIRGEYHSLIGEVQFLLKDMNEFKNKQHPLYSIQRKKEFLSSMVDILPFLTDIPKTLNVNATLGNLNGICDVMVTQHLNVKQIVSKQYKNNIFDIVCTSGHVRAAKFLMEIMSDSMITERLCSINDWTVPFYAEIFKTGNRQILELIFKHKGEFKNNINDNGWIHIFDNMMRYCDFETSKIILMIENIYKKISITAWKEAISRSLKFGKRDFLALFTNLCGEHNAKQIFISENCLQISLRTNWNEYRMELAKYIINFSDYKKNIKDTDIADALYISVDKDDINTFNMICNDLIKSRNDTVEKYLLIPHFKQNETTLQCACKAGNKSEFIDILLSHITQNNMAKYINHKNGECTAIAYLARNGETHIIDKFLTIPGIDLFGENKEKTSCSIIEALKKSNILIAEKLYSKLSDDQKNYKYDDKLLWDTIIKTTKKSDLRSLKFIITNLLKSTDILINCDDKTGSLITIATESNNIDKVEFICSVIPKDKIANLINYQKENRQNAIMIASEMANIKILKYFATIPGVNFECRDKSNNTAFRNCAWSGKFEIAEFLFIQNKKDNERLKSLRYLNKSGNAAFIYINDEDGKKKLAEIVSKHINFTKIDLNELNDEKEFGENAICWAAKIGIMDIINKLLQIKGIIVSPNSILKAVEVDIYSTGELKIAQKLYNHLCDDGKNKLSFNYDNKRLFDILRKLCYSRDKDEKKSIEMLQFVVSKLIDNKYLCDILLIRGESNNLALETLLLTSLKHKKTEVCKYIMSIIPKDKIIDEINYQNNWGLHVLEYAAKDGHIDLFKHIISKYQHVNTSLVNNYTGNSTFHIAATFGHIDICQLILSQCINNQQKISLINQKNKKNETAIMVSKNKSVQIQIQKWKTQFSN